MTASPPDGGQRDLGTLVVGLGLTLLGLSLLGMTLFVGLTETATRADFAEYHSECDELDTRSRMVDAGLGMRPEPLNETAVRRCQNATFAQYRAGRLQSMQHTPFNAKQWVLALGVSGLLTAIGVVPLRQELRVTM